MESCRRMVRRTPVALVLFAIFRFALVVSWHKPAGDGVQYYRLAQELRRDHRFAFAPPPAPPSYARLPGYPLFLAEIVARSPLSLEGHCVRAAAWNVVLDFGTALILFLLLRSTGIGWPVHGAWLILCWPTLWLMSCYSLTESLSIFLAATEIYFAMRLMREGSIRAATLAGLAAGVAQLVRFDAATFLPSVVLAIWYAPGSRWRKSGLVGAFALSVGLAFGGWPIRNLIQFGHPHFAAVTWRTMLGKELGTGPVDWARTWASSRPGESFWEIFLANERPIEIARSGVLLPTMYDDSTERARLVRLLQQYNHEGLSAAVDSGFHELALAKLRAHPLRVLIWLPVQRVLHLFMAEPEYEMPLVVPWLGLPAARPVLGWADQLWFLLAAGGAFLLWRGRRSERGIVLVLGSGVLARVALYAVAIPHATTGRYLVEAFPIFAVFAAVGLGRIADRLGRGMDTTSDPLLEWSPAQRDLHRISEVTRAEANRAGHPG